MMTAPRRRATASRRPLVVEDVADPTDARAEQQVGQATPDRAAELRPQQVEDERREALEELDDDVAGHRVGTRRRRRAARSGPGPRRCRRSAGRRRRAARSPAGSAGRPCPSPRRSRAGRPGASRPRAPAPRRSRPSARTGRGSRRSNPGSRRCRAAPWARRQIIWTASAGRSTPGSRPDTQDRGRHAGSRVAGGHDASASPLRTRSQATRIEESFFSRSASAGCSSIPMTCEAWTIETFGGSGAGDPAERRPRHRRG